MKPDPGPTFQVGTASTAGVCALVSTGLILLETLARGLPVNL